MNLRIWAQRLGLLLGGLSGLLALGSVAFAFAIGGFRYFDPNLITIFRLGLALAVSGLVVSLIGAARPGPLRWYAVVMTAGALAFSLTAISVE